MKKKTEEKSSSPRPFALEFLETVPEAELKAVTGAASSGLHTNYISLVPRPDRG